MKGRISHPHKVERGFALAQRLPAEGTDVANWVSHLFALDESTKPFGPPRTERESRPIKVALDPSI